MPLSVRNANPGSISSVGVISPGTISGVTTGGSGQTYNPQGPTYNPQQAAGIGGSGGYTGGSVQGASTYVAPVDPYARWGGQVQHDGLVNGFNTEFGQTQGSANTALDNFGKQYGLSILDYVNQGKTGQQGIDSGYSNLYGAQYQGKNAINQKVGQGIQSGGVMLANKNAGDSSGAEGIARAYAQFGERELRNVNNQFESGKNALVESQKLLDQQLAAQANKIKTEAEMGAAQIIDETNRAVSGLTQRMQGQDIATTVAMQQEIQRVKDAAAVKLRAIDSDLTNKRGTIKAGNQNSLQARGRGNVNAGKPVNNPFDFDLSPELSMQGAGLPSSLPLYVKSPGYKAPDEQTLPIYT
jgi:hypothetical protein